MLDEGYSHDSKLTAKKIDALIKKLCSLRSEKNETVRKFEVDDCIILAEEIQREPKYLNSLFR